MAGWESLALDSNLSRGCTPRSQIPGPPGRGLGTGLITLSCKKLMITETTTDVNHACPLRVGADNIIETATKDRHAKQRMTFNKLIPLFSPQLVTKVAQWNVRTMYETGRCAQIAKETRNYNIDVLGIGEARWNQSGQITLSTGEEVLYSGNENENDYHTKGVAIMLSKKAKNSLMEWEPVNERLMWVRLQAKCQNFTIIQCYAPTNDADEEDIENFYEKLQHTWDNTPKRDIRY